MQSFFQDKIVHNSLKVILENNKKSLSLLKEYLCSICNESSIHCLNKKYSKSKNYISIDLVIKNRYCHLPKFKKLIIKIPGVRYVI